MKVSSVSGLVLLVKDLKKTTKFYEDLGFRPGKGNDKSQTMYVNWYWVEFVKVNNFKATGNDSQFIYLSVLDLDETHKELKAKGLKPTEPQEFPSGRREVMISDPDGYKLVFFSKK